MASARLKVGSIYQPEISNMQNTFVRVENHVIKRRTYHILSTCIGPVGKFGEQRTGYVYGGIQLNPFLNKKTSYIALKSDSTTNKHAISLPFLHSRWCVVRKCNWLVTNKFMTFIAPNSPFIFKTPQNK